MAQADQNIANQTGASFRADLNNQLLALVTQSSGNSAPITTYAFQPWVDTSTSPATWKIRNAANTGWISVGSLDSTFAVGGVTALANGGTGQTSASAAINALVPSQTGNSGKALTTNGTAVSWGTIAAGASIQYFTSSATYTPTNGKTTFLAFATGGGGGSGGSLNGGSSGAGGGGTAIRLYSATEMGASATVTVGAAGSAGSSGAGGTGGASSFDPAGTGLTMTGSGGGGSLGGSGAPNSPGAGGGTTNSLFAIDGQRGGYGYGEAGGVSFWAGGRGRGAPGNASASSSGAAGTAGVVVILEW